MEMPQEMSGEQMAASMPQGGAPQGGMPQEGMPPEQGLLSEADPNQGEFPEDNTEPSNDNQLTSGDEEEFKATIDQAKELLYGENFENMINVFQKAGKEGFPEAMATVVNGTLDRLEQENGEMAPQILIMTGYGITAMLASDMTNAEVVPDLDKDIVQVALAAVTGKWMEQHEDRADVPRAMEDIQKMGQKQKGSGDGMLAQQPNATGMGGIG
jgi:hypothetical protein